MTSRVYRIQTSTQADEQARLSDDDFVNAIRATLASLTHTLHHNGNHNQGPLSNCARCVAVALLAKIDSDL